VREISGRFGKNNNFTTTDAIQKCLTEKEASLQRVDKQTEQQSIKHHPNNSKFFQPSTGSMVVGVAGTNSTNDQRRKSQHAKGFQFPILGTPDD
jgi:hypothetical protein